jgi:hypothetical protein
LSYAHEPYWAQCRDCSQSAAEAAAQLPYPISVHKPISRHPSEVLQSTLVGGATLDAAGMALLDGGAALGACVAAGSRSQAQSQMASTIAPPRSP